MEWQQKEDSPVKWIVIEGAVLVSHGREDIILGTDDTLELLPEGFYLLNRETGNRFNKKTKVRYAFSPGNNLYYKNPNHMDMDQDLLLAIKLAEQEKVVSPMMDPSSARLAQELQDAEYVRMLLDKEKKTVAPVMDPSSARLAQELQDAEYVRMLLDKENREKQEAEGIQLAKRLQEEEEQRRKKREEEEDLSFAKALELNLQFEEEEMRRAMEEYAESISKRNARDEEETMKLLRKEGLLGPGGYWSKLLPDNVPFERTVIEKGNKLYHLVESRFKKAGKSIVRIETVQNHKVWQAYVEAKLAYPDRQELYRFHGTPYINVDGICKSGFLVSKDVAGGGTKIWSAPEDNPLYSVGYSQRGAAPDGTLYMFLAKVWADQTTTNQWTVNAGAFMYPEFLIVFK
jgi:hypothetical protein